MTAFKDYTAKLIAAYETELAKYENVIHPDPVKEAERVRLVAELKEGIEKAKNTNSRLWF